MAPILADASMEMASCGETPMYKVIRSPLPMPRARSAEASRLTSRASSA